MEHNGSKKVRVWIDLWIARAGVALGWVLFTLWVLAAFGGILLLIRGEAEDSTYYIMPFVCIGIAALHILMIRSFRKTKALIADFRLYSSILSENEIKSVEVISKKLGTDPKIVRDRVQQMCRRGYYSGYFDFSEQILVFNQPADSLCILKCPGCGAPNAIRKNGDTCIYCGSPLKRNDIA